MGASTRTSHELVTGGEGGYGKLGGWGLRRINKSWRDLPWLRCHMLHACNDGPAESVSPAPPDLNVPPSTILEKEKNAIKRSDTGVKGQAGDCLRRGMSTQRMRILR